MNKANQYFKQTIQDILNNGVYDKNPRPKWKDGSAAHTKYITHVIHQYDLEQNEFPVVTLRPISFDKAINEMLWIYQDQSNSLKLLNNKYGIKWWNDFDIGDNTIGTRYGETVRKHDIINNLLNTFTNDIESRRKVISLWQEDDFKETEGLKPCFFNCVFDVRDNKLDLMLTSRSSDFITAYSINCVQYVCLQMILAKLFNLNLGKFTVCIANCHIYDRHLSIAQELLLRPDTEQPIISIDNIDDFYEVTSNNFHLSFNSPYKQIKIEIAI